MGPNPNGPRLVSCDRAIRYSGLGVRSVGPVGDFLDFNIKFDLFPPIWAPLNDLWEIHQQKSAKIGTYLVVDGGSYPTIYIDQRIFPC